jgi:hypothetical protein
VSLFFASISSTKGLDKEEQGGGRRGNTHTSPNIILIPRLRIWNRRIIKQPHNTPRTSLILIMSGAKPIRRNFQSFCKQFKKFVAECMAGIAEFCYGGYVCGERDREWLVGCSVCEFADVEGSGLQGLVGGRKVGEGWIVLFEVTSLGVKLVVCGIRRYGRRLYLLITRIECFLLHRNPSSIILRGALLLILNRTLEELFTLFLPSTFYSCF